MSHTEPQVVITRLEHAIQRNEQKFMNKNKAQGFVKMGDVVEYIVQDSEYRQAIQAIQQLLEKVEALETGNIIGKLKVDIDTSELVKKLNETKDSISEGFPPCTPMGERAVFIPVPPMASKPIYLQQCGRISRTHPHGSTVYTAVERLTKGEQFFNELGSLCEVVEIDLTPVSVLLRAKVVGAEDGFCGFYPRGHAIQKPCQR